MDVRKCIYTGKDARVTDKVIPKNGGDEVHNWANTVPCSSVYKKNKGMDFPTELELKTNRAFKMLELAKLDIQFYTHVVDIDALKEAVVEANSQEREFNRLRFEIEKAPLRVTIKNTLEVKESLKSSSKQKKKKNKEIEMAYKEKEIIEMNLDKILNKKKMEW